MDEFIEEEYMKPYGISNEEVLEATDFADHWQKVAIADFRTLLLIKKFNKNYLLVVGDFYNKTFVVQEVYKIFSDIVGNTAMKDLDLVQILERFYNIVGFEINFAGKTFKFIRDYQSIGIPRISNCDDSNIRKEFIFLNPAPSQTNLPLGNPRWRINKGNYVDFVNAIWMYALNPKAYSKYLSRNS